MSMRSNRPAKKGMESGGGCCADQGAVPVDDEKEVIKEGTPVPNWKLWKGKNVFALGGRAMLGADARIFAITNAFVVATCLVFFGDLCPRVRPASSATRRRPES